MRSAKRNTYASRSARPWILDDISSYILQYSDRIAIPLYSRISLCTMVHRIRWDIVAYKTAHRNRSCKCTSHSVKKKLFNTERFRIKNINNQGNNSDDLDFTYSKILTSCRLINVCLFLLLRKILFFLAANFCRRRISTLHKLYRNAIL